MDKYLENSSQKYASIMFIDIINSSELSNNMSVEEYGEFIEDFHKLAWNSTVRDSLSHYQKWECEKFDPHGDELKLILFSDDINKDIETLFKIAFRLRIEWFLSDFNKERIKSKKPPIELGIGIHCGPVYIHPNYVVAGDEWISEGYNINLAKRIEGCSREGEYTRIMLSQTVYNIFTTDEKFRSFFDFKKVESISLKGFSEKVNIYELRSFWVIDNPLINEYLKLKSANAEEEITNENELLNYCNEALEIYPFNVWICSIFTYYFNKRNLNFKGGVQKAIEIIEGVCRDTEEKPEILYLVLFLGYFHDAYSSLPFAKIEKAIMYNELGLQIDNYNIMAQFNLAVAISHLSDKANGGRSKELENRTLQAYIRAEFLYKMHEIDEKSSFEWKIPLFLGHCYKNLGDYNEAKLRYERARNVLKKEYNKPLQERWLTECLQHLKDVCEKLDMQDTAEYIECCREFEELQKQNSKTSTNGISMQSSTTINTMQSLSSASSNNSSSSSTK